MTHKNLSKRRQCKLLELNRSSLYYSKRPENQKNLEIMRRIDEQYTRMPYYGVRRMTAWLNQEGYGVNPKRVRRLMRLMGLEAIYPKPKTSQSNKQHRVYPYLLKNMCVTKPNEVWAADITYIPMEQGFVYLMAIMDWYSRFVLSYRISTSLDTSFCVEALEEALSKYPPPDIFNTDQGSQFTSDAWIETLKRCDIDISMDGRGRYLDNIFVERLWRSVKYEDVYIKQYETVREVKGGLKEYFHMYNYQRLHQALDYRPPGDIFHGVVNFPKTYSKLCEFQTGFGHYDDEVNNLDKFRA